MSPVFSSSFNASLHLPPVSSSSNIYVQLYRCLMSSVGIFLTIAYSFVITFLLLPLCVFVLYLGHQRWRHQRLGTTMSISDCFTYNMVVMELLCFFGSILMSCGVHAQCSAVFMAGSYLCSLIYYGQTWFHLLSCVDRYLAVVHPVTYLGLRRASGVRNATTGCVWLLCCLWTGVFSTVDFLVANIAGFCVLTSAVAGTSFCSVSVLCVLTRAGPGEGSRDRPQLDPSKLKAFYTILAILGALMLRFGGVTVTACLYNSELLNESEQCGVWLSQIWLSLPSSLVLPLLFLHRARKLKCCKTNNQSGQESA